SVSRRRRRTRYGRDWSSDVCSSDLINAITDLRNEEDMREEGREKDKLLEKGMLLGDLHGLPMTVKDSFNVIGLKTSNGHPLYRKIGRASCRERVERWRWRTRLQRTR